MYHAPSPEVVFADDAGLQAVRLRQWGGARIVQKYGPTILSIIKSMPDFCNVKMVHYYLIEYRIIRPYVSVKNTQRAVGLTIIYVNASALPYTIERRQAGNIYSFVLHGGATT